MISYKVFVRISSDF